MIPSLFSKERGAEERALVEGRRPGFGEAVAFDEAAVEIGAW